jgi:hypothetical protein
MPDSSSARVNYQYDGGEEEGTGGDRGYSS